MQVHFLFKGSRPFFLGRCGSRIGAVLVLNGQMSWHGILIFRIILISKRGYRSRLISSDRLSIECERWCFVQVFDITSSMFTSKSFNFRVFWNFRFTHAVFSISLFSIFINIIKLCPEGQITDNLHYLKNSKILKALFIYKTIKLWLKKNYCIKINKYMHNNTIILHNDCSGSHGITKW